MIGLFDSGHGGLTVLKALVERFPGQQFLYLGDHANAPYGNRPSEEVVELTRAAIAWLFDAGCPLVLLACNTATAVACRTLQRDWLPASGRKGVNVLGIVAPTVEAATQTPWAITTPQYPQKYLTETIAVFGTARTIASGVYKEEIRKRCPRVNVVQQSVHGSSPPSRLARRRQRSTGWWRAMSLISWRPRKANGPTGPFSVVPISHWLRAPFAGICPRVRGCYRNRASSPTASRTISSATPNI